MRAQIGTLERAYQIVQMLNTPSQQFNVLGLIAPGAGWAGGLAPATPAQDWAHPCQPDMHQDWAHLLPNLRQGWAYP